MKNFKKISFAKIYFLSIALTVGLNCTPYLLNAQTPLEVHASVDNINCKATLHTTFPTISDASNGLFFRLDEINGKGSYYWNETVLQNTTSTTTLQDEVVTLPQGTYKVVAYQTKKSGPIRTGYSEPNGTSTFQITNSGCTSFESIFASNVSSSPIPAVTLKASWNIFTDPGYTQYYGSYLNEVHSHFLTNNTLYNTSTTPWLFVTLSVHNWSALNDIQVEFNNQGLQFVEAIEGNVNIGWPHIQLTYTANTNITNKVKVSKVSSTLSQEVHIHLIFQVLDRTKLGLDETFTAYYTTHPAEAPGSVAISVPVREKPHDPNKLEVDHDRLCPCQSGEELTYQIHYQNTGKAPATEVKIRLYDLEPWTINSTGKIIDANGNASTATILHNKQIVYNYNTIDRSYDFDIKDISNTLNGINLLGTEQKPNPSPIQEVDTRDYFNFKIKKRDCSQVGVIKPYAAIEFLDGADSMGKMNTNLSPTVISAANKEGINNCRYNTVCTKCIKKRRCWLLRLFS